MIFNKDGSQGGSEYTVYIHSLYWNNVDPKLVEAQERVFLKFGHTIEQHNLHGKDHGLWIEEILDATSETDVVLIVDIDCIPLSSQAIDHAVDSALQGKVFGCAQAANHLDSSFVYAGPMFLALTGETWRKLSSPSMQADGSFDVGGRLTYSALEAEVEVELVYPSEVGVPKWLLGNKGIFGSFTVYQGSYLHLFESRNNNLVESFVELAGEIYSGQVVDYRKYVIRASLDSHKTYGDKLVEEASFFARFKKRLKKIRMRR